MTAEAQEKCSEHSVNSGKPAVCIGCGESIHDPYILRVAPDLEWHADCLRCVECSRPLDESCTCFVRSGRTYCKEDYTRLFSGLRKCARCCEEFQTTDFVMRAKDKIYHVDCFKCTNCSRLLMTGEEFSLQSDGPLCKADHECLEKGAIQDGNMSDGSSGDGTVYTRKTPTPSGNTNSSTNNRENNNDAKNTSIDSVDSVKSEPSKSGATRERRSKDSKPTRVRTVLNEKQLHTLRTCYGANPRPDALMKEQLVEMTGLSPRVIRVWFQNKRCKDKKRTILMKQIVESQEKNGRLPPNMQGMPMVASSPVRHESSLQANPVEVQTYQQNWETVAKYQGLGPHELESASYPPPMSIRYEETPPAMHQNSPFLTPPNSANKESESFSGFVPHRLHMLGGEMAHCVM